MPLPPNLTTLHAEEERLRAESLAFIDASDTLREHVDLIQASLNFLFDFTTLHPAGSDADQLTVQLLGIRMFNAAVSTLKLALSGYYQNAFNVHRDLVETSFLLDYFTIYKTRIAAWRNSDYKERQKTFSPRVVREALNARDGFTVKTKRDSVYAALCELGTHPTYGGNRLIAPGRLAKIGPFFDAELVELAINELALRLPHGTLFYGQFFAGIVPGLLKARAEQVDRIDAWTKKYFGASIILSHSKPGDDSSGGTKGSTNAE